MVLTDNRCMIISLTRKWHHRVAAPISFFLLIFTQAALAANSYITRFGLPADYTPAYFLGGVSLALAVFSGVLVILAAVSWVKRYWSLPRRIFFSLVAAVAVLFVVMIARWGMITMLL